MSIYNRNHCFVVKRSAAFFKESVHGPWRSLPHKSGLSQWRMAQKVRQMRQNRFSCSQKALGEQVPQMCGNTLFRHHAGLPAEGFFISCQMLLRSRAARCQCGTRAPHHISCALAYRHRRSASSCGGRTVKHFPFSGSQSGQHAGPPRDEAQFAYPDTGGADVSITWYSRWFLRPLAARQPAVLRLRQVPLLLPKRPPLNLQQLHLAMLRSTRTADTRSRQRAC